MYKVTIIICLLLSVIFLFLFIISPKSSFTIPKTEKYTSLDDFSKSKLQEALKGMIDSKKMNFTLTFNEEELNDLVGLFYNSNKANISYFKGINGIKCVIIDKKIDLSANVKVLNRFLVGYKTEFTPIIEDNEIVLKIAKSYVGAIQIPNSISLNLLKTKDNGNFSVGVDNSSIILINSFPKQFELNNIYIKDNMVNLDVNVSIKSIQDFYDILGKFTK